MASAARSAREVRRLVGAAFMLSVLAALAVAAFTWPQARLEPRDLPLGLAGPDRTAAPAEQQLTEGGRYDVRRYEDAAAARRAVEERDVYGALVVSPGRTRLLTTSAASPLVAQL